MDLNNHRVPGHEDSSSSGQKFFPHHEFRYYAFGLRTGIANFSANGLGLGIKKTLGKIAQPVNSYTRFPEYSAFDSAIRTHLSNLPKDQEVRILDVGSPKLLGLYLGANTRAEMMLTDISPLNVDEYQTMWKGLEKRAPGRAAFSLQDARSLRFDSSQFDVVYSMSVVEHIEADGDGEAIKEMLRVLKPGGLLVISIPFGSRYQEQMRLGFSGAVRETGDSRSYFFQRIYDRTELEKRILPNLTTLSQLTFTTVWRENSWACRGFAGLGQNLRGAMGFVNPLLSILVNRSCSGIRDSFAVRYGTFHSAGDIYGDLIISGKKL